MKYFDFQYALSSERLSRYLLACGGDTRKAMTLYRLNLYLSKEVYTLLSCLEVALRNAIDRRLSDCFGDDWLRDAVLAEGIFDITSCRYSAKIILKAYERLNRKGEYSHHKLLAEMEFGVWKYMFANPQYRATGQMLLDIFPKKPRSSRLKQYNQAYVFNVLDGINILRNRIAHHEPICFALKSPVISTDYILKSYEIIHELFRWMGIESRSLLYGLDHVRKVCAKINQL